jgi:hypothetical protein
MGEQERPGEHNAYRWRGADPSRERRDEADSEGHGIKFKGSVTDSDKPLNDTEGQGLKWKVGDGTDQPSPGSQEAVRFPGRVAEDDTEGHAIRGSWKASSENAPGPKEAYRGRPATDDDSEAHALRAGRGADDDESDDVEGNAARINR